MGPRALRCQRRRRAPGPMGTPEPTSPLRRKATGPRQPQGPPCHPKSTVPPGPKWPGRWKGPMMRARRRRRVERPRRVERQRQGKRPRRGKRPQRGKPRQARPYRRAPATARPRIRTCPARWPGRAPGSTARTGGRGRSPGPVVTARRTCAAGRAAHSDRASWRAVCPGQSRPRPSWRRRPPGRRHRCLGRNRGRPECYYQGRRYRKGHRRGRTRFPVQAMTGRHMDLGRRRYARWIGACRPAVNGSAGRSWPVVN
jgi:hypothetical protein